MQLITQQKTKLSHWWKMWGLCSVGMSCVWAVQTSAGSRRELLSYILTWLLWDISMLTRQRRLFRRCRLISFLKVLHDMRFNIRVVQDSFDLMMHCRKCQQYYYDSSSGNHEVHGNQLITSRVHPLTDAKTVGMSEHSGLKPHSPRVPALMWKWK